MDGIHVQSTFYIQLMKDKLIKMTSEILKIAFVIHIFGTV